MAASPHLSATRPTIDNAEAIEGSHAVTRPLRVLVAQNVPKDRRGGMSRLLGFIHDRVSADGHRVDYFGAEDVPPSSSGRRARLAFPLLVRRHARRAAAAGRPYDVINVHEPSAWAVVARRGPLGHPIVAVTTHGLEERGWHVLREDARLGREHLRWRSRMTVPATVVWPSQFALRHADHVFCLNESDRRYLLERYPHAESQVTRVFPAADSAYLDAYPARDYAAPATHLLWFGTWLVRKGTPDAVAAFSALADRHASLRLIVMGAGVPEQIVARAFPERLRSRVEYVSHVSGAASAQHAAHVLRASVYVLPSVFEGTPLTLLETMATGLTPVSTAVCGMKDVIRDGENGVLVPPRDPVRLAGAIDRVLIDRALRERLGRQAHADVAARYTWDRVSEPVRAVYRDMAAHPRIAERWPGGGLNARTDRVEATRTDGQTGLLNSESTRVEGAHR
jgi:glycosyltransferase involved in cell wall biosynthesis